MTVKCKMTQCPYHSGQGFCAKAKVVCIDENGMCSVLWKRGQQFMRQKDVYLKEPMIIIDAAETELHGVQEAKKEEGGEPVEEIS